MDPRRSIPGNSETTARSSHPGRTCMMHSTATDLRTLQVIKFDPRENGSKAELDFRSHTETSRLFLLMLSVACLMYINGH
ncbi:hypothetical protein BDV38DRAFT_250627 [Aspergillus pseudotamarii]|uniref:Uncharacterized protein n=1 Tax=Aspergillus pseudotamarii TaxID=132259 RepID=A0A5N6SQS2_ASPPS|nr:uncharacterized protein BDV38DRAFT_250627 [Aspergillus pseudotamarii]KAE8136120.1 hypothetical protein BDV38DRAFT_250627 [Aspergillus pseudotamarii]